MIKDKSILLLAIGQTLVWAGLYYIFPALLLRWEQSLGWSKADLTFAIMLAVFLSAVFSPLFGRLIDRGLGPQLMAGSAVFGGLCLIGLSLTESLWQFYMVWGLMGIAMAGCLYEPCFALVTRVRGEDAKKAIIFITLVAGFASTISFPTVHGLAEAAGWRMAVKVFSATVIFVAAPLIWFGARQLEQSGKVGAEQTINVNADQSFLKKPVFWVLAMAFMFGAMLHGVTLHHFLPILDSRGIQADVAVLAASFIGPMQVAGRLAMMASERHVSNHGVAKACFICMGGAIVLLIAAGTTPGLLVAFVILFGGAYGTVSIIRPVIAREFLGGKNFGAKSGALAVPFLLGSAAAPYIGSVVWGYGGYDLVLYCLIVLAALGYGLYSVAYQLSKGHE